MTRKILIAFLACIVLGATTWAVVHFVRRHRRLAQANNNVAATTNADPNEWLRATEKIKETRVEATPSALIIPTELKHYSERYWFLATQVAEIEKHNVHTCQDFLDLAGVIQRGEMVTVPAVTDTYVLFGVGEKADDKEFTRFEPPSLPGETEEPEQQVKTVSSEDQQKLSRDYESLYSLAKSFAGRSYDLNSASDRHSLKMEMLRSLRPEALKILEEVATAYHRQFDRHLPVSSLVRPEQYQHALNRVNRNAVLIDSPPHSTGLAFDIDYRYMSAGEQTFLMAELARIKNEGRIEVIRERNANYHVFAFIHGVRPGDDLITASLEKARPPGQEAHHAEAKPKKAKAKARVKSSKRRTR
jgi:Family of unknown function (DUF5715)